jgi:hypothetical protein
MPVVQDATSQDQRTFQSRSPWLVAVTLVVVLTVTVAGAVSAWMDGGLYWLAMPLMVAFTLLLSLRSVRRWHGRTEVDGDAITAIAGSARVVLPWSQVAAIEVSPSSWFGRVVGVRTRDARRAKALPAPTVGMFGSRRHFASDVAEFLRTVPDHVEVSGDGDAPAAGRRLVVLRTVGVAFFWVLLVLAVALGLLVVWATQPWNSPRWPWAHEASITPQACAVVDAALVERLLAGATDGQPESSPGPITDSTTCSWTSPEDRSLTLVVARHQQSGRRSATGDAVSHIDISRRLRFDGAPYEAVSGVGDEAWSARTSTTATQPRPGVGVLARRANVVVEVQYRFDGSGPAAAPEGHRADVVEVARSAIDAVEVD